MFCFTFGFVVISFCAFSRADNAKCTSEINSYHSCQKAYIKNEMANRPDPRKKENDIKTCFTNSGCKAPTLSGEKNGENDINEKCRKEFQQNIQNIMKPCLQKSLNVVLPDENDDHDDQRHGPPSSAHGEAHENVKTLCATDDQRNKAQTCLKILFNLTKEGKEAGLQKTKSKFAAICENKRQCFAKISPECQAILNKTKSASCDCAKSDLAPKADSLNQQFMSCTSGTPRPNKNGGKRNFADGLIRMVCNDSNNEDPCSKPFRTGGSDTGSTGRDRVNENKQN